MGAAIGKDADGYFIVLAEGAPADDVTTTTSIIDLEDVGMLLCDDLQDVDSTVPELPDLQSLLVRHLLIPFLSGTLSAGLEHLKQVAFRTGTPVIAAKPKYETIRSKWYQRGWQWLVAGLGKDGYA
jgi:hypothetical protein